MWALSLAALCISAAYSAECIDKPDPNAQPNDNVIYSTVPSLVRSVENAKLFTVGGGNDTISLVHLYGTPYEMGFAHGTLMKKEAVEFMDDVWQYLLSQVESALNGTAHNLKPWFLDLVAEVGLDATLRLTEDATRQYTGVYFYEELQGLADATGLTIQRLIDIHMVGELTQSHCSMYGAWGQATQPSNTLLQLCALDWDIDGPFQNYPQITVYHPNNASNGHAFANVGWTAWVGSLAGISSKQMAISDIGVAFPDATFGNMSRFGVPFTFLLRDILQFDESLEAAKARITEAHRTCDLILGVGDAKPNGGFNGIEYSASTARFFNDKNNEPTADWHPLIDEVVYYGMDWLCPAYDSVLAAQLNKHYGNITAANTIRDITAIVQTGDLHVVIYDLTNMIMYTANAARDGVDGPKFAYQRSFVQLDMNAAFAVTL